MKSETDIVNAYTYQLGPGRHILYFGDPMCSWCWGFAPVINEMLIATQTKSSFQVITTGLRPGVLEPWDDQLRGSIRHHWQSVVDKTGQPFDFARVDDSGFIYNTEPACRAVVTVRNLKPNATFEMFESLQRAFYAEGQDITTAETLSEIARTCGVDPATFMKEFNQQVTQDQTLKDFQLTRIFGVRGFPTMLLINDQGIQTLTTGYQPWKSLRPRLEEWLNT
ncbi:MAG: DsbA family protein [Rhodospirillaceae bacterium]|nr:MAG: DsbA family protein [Rhodospirillaceae bacterium]